MSYIFKIFKRNFKTDKSNDKFQHKDKAKNLIGSPSDSIVSVTPLTNTSSNLTLISSVVDPVPKATKFLRENRFSNSNVLSNDENVVNMTELKSDLAIVKDVDEKYLSFCLSSYSREKTSSATTNSLECLKGVDTKNYNNTSCDNAIVPDPTISKIRIKLNEDYERLVKKNVVLKVQFERTSEKNAKLKNEIEELENLNQKLLSDNTEVLQEAIKHRFLKLESEDLSKKTSQYKQKLEEKENLIVSFQKQYETLKVKNNVAYKRKEEALLDASHSHIKLKELANDCAELDIYKCESLQRKYYFNELQNVFGKIRVYLKIKPTIGESCVSFLADDKILISIDDKKPKNLICRFTKVFQPQHNNVDIFEEIQPLLTTVVDGYNCSFINYGQKESGKCATFFGSHKNPGILYRSLSYLLLSTENMNNQECSLYVSAIEIHRENITDVLRKRQLHVFDDGCNIILKNAEEKLVKNLSHCNQLVSAIHEERNSENKVGQFPSHLIVIIRVNITSKVSKEICCGVAMLCDLADFESENNLCTADRSFIKEERILHDTLIDLGKTLITLKSKHKRLPRPNTTLTKILQPCLSSHSKCCLIIHSLSDKDQYNAIVKTLQYGLAVMPKMEEKETQGKDVIQWEFCDNEA